MSITTPLETVAVRDAGAEPPSGSVPEILARERAALAWTDAVTRVALDSSDGVDTWGSIGVSENVIAASWQALVDSIDYGMQPGRRPAPERSVRA